MKVKLRFEKRIHPTPPTLILELSGEVSSGRSLESLIELIHGSDYKFYVVSMRDVQYINSSGFGELAELHLKCEERGKSLYFADLSDKISAVFETMGGNNFMRIAPTVDEALAAIAPR